MGCGMSTEEKEGKERNEQIENQLKRDKLLQRNEIKMLLLGKADASSSPVPSIDHRDRRGRIGQINNPQADETHSRR